VISVWEKSLFLIICTVYPVSLVVSKLLISEGFTRVTHQYFNTELILPAGQVLRVFVVEHKLFIHSYIKRHPSEMLHQSAACRKWWRCSRFCSLFTTKENSSPICQIYMTSSFSLYVGNDHFGFRTFVLFTALMSPR